jgi:hypothetical protein
MSDWFILALTVACAIGAIWGRKYIRENPPPKKTQPGSRKQILDGFWWHKPPQLPLAAGRGWNTTVRGESFRQEALLRAVGGRGRYGSNWNVAAQLTMVDDIPGHPTAVAVSVDGELVGYIPSELSAQIRDEFLALEGIENGVTCKATIVGGWDSTAEGGERGHFGIKLSLSRPLKIRKA